MSNADTTATLGPNVVVLSGFAFPSAGFNQVEGLPLIRIRDLARANPEVRFRGRYDAAYLIKKGDVLIGMDGDFEVHRWSGDTALLNQRVCKVEAATRQVDQRFLYWYLKPKVAEIHRRTPQTTVRHLSASDLYLIPGPRIGSAEQSAVAQILDTLDTAIHETEAIIAKLKAVKQGLVHDLLTRGIDANGELRPPQAEAPHLYKASPLGEIPKEWDLATLEAVSTAITSGSRDWARFYADSGALFVRIGNLTREHINFRFDSTMYVRPPRDADGQRTRLEPGDVLISITADLGIVGVVPGGMGEAYINQHIALVRPSASAVNPRFVGHYLAGPVSQAYISKLNDAGAKAGLNLPTVRGLLTARPERTEQNLIAERLDEIDTRIKNTSTESAKLRELKAGLMDDLLTGRVLVTPLLETAAS